MTEALDRLKVNALLEAYQSILEFYFGNIERATIEKMAMHDLYHFDLQDVELVSKHLGLTTRIDRTTLREVTKEHYPVIACDDSGDAIVVYAKNGNQYEICQGQHLERELIDEKRLRHYDRVVFFEKAAVKNRVMEAGEPKDKSWFFKPVKEEWRTFTEIAILTFFINIFALAIPLFSRAVYDRVVPNYAVESLYVLAAGVVIVLLFDMILKSSRLKLMEESSKRIAQQLEEELFEKILTVSKLYDRYMVGTKVNLFKEISGIKDFFTSKIVQLLDLPFFFIAVTVIYMISPAMAVIPLAGATISIIFNFGMQYPIASLYRKSFEETQSRQGYLVEQIQGDEAIRLANALPTRLHKWRRLLSFYHDVQKKIAHLNGLSGFISQGMIQGIYLLTIVVGVHEIHTGALSVGGLIAITILSGRAMVPVIHLSGVVSRYKQVKESLEVLNNYWHLPTETQKYTEPGLGKAKGKITFENVSFVYPGMQRKSIDDVSFTINPGERVGIIGQTGAGKSTIQKLLTGIYHPSEGRVFLDDQDISSLHPVELRHNIALMPQVPYLFSGTLKENLELSRKLSKEEMTTLLEKTGLMSLVRQSAHAQALNVGERGENLSVGQRHLVALARALVNDAPVLILDEPTTGLDVGLERRLISHLNESTQEKTLIVITHRLAALELVDRVILIDQGRVVADGPKHEILKLLKGSKS